MNIRMVLGAGLLLASGMGLWAATNAPKWNLEEVKCVVSGEAVDEGKSVDYKEGKLFFCCGNCAKTYSDAPEEYTAKANMHLVASSQYKQGGCPFSGGDVNDETIITVGQAKVGFCCNDCKGKVEKAEEAEQLTMVFSDEAFEKGKFAVAEEEKE
jgi:YHS domain-containing protein